MSRPSLARTVLELHTLVLHVLCGSHVHLIKIAQGERDGKKLGVGEGNGESAVMSERGEEGEREREVEGDGGRGRVEDERRERERERNGQESERQSG